METQYTINRDKLKHTPPDLVVERVAQFIRLCSWLKLVDMYLTKNNFIFISEILEHVFHVVYQMRPAFVGIQLYPLVFYKAP